MFYRNAINLSLPVIECQNVSELVKSGDILEVDLDSALIKNVTTKDQAKGEKIPSHCIEILEKGGQKTPRAIWSALPFEERAEIWKEEVYFEIPVKIQIEKPTSSTKAGDVSYWPDGPAFCIFYGSSQPISPVETFARIKSGIEKFRDLKNGDRITVKRSK